MSVVFHSITATGIPYYRHMSIRYKGPDTSLASYMERFEVCCPECGKCASVFGPLFDWTNYVLRCDHCKTVRKAVDTVRYEARIKKNCNHCGSPIAMALYNLTTPLKKQQYRCEVCGIVDEHQPKNIPYLPSRKNSTPSDPVFGLSLWYQSPIRGKVLWAYNKEHLLTIRDYVAAKLRERNGSVHTSMVEKLPTFISAAKNRQLVLKTIEKLLLR